MWNIKLSNGMAHLCTMFRDATVAKIASSQSLLVSRSKMSAYSGTVVPAHNFDAEADSKTLRKAMKGLGTDEKAIIDILAYRSNEQRQEIKTQYKSMFGRDLLSDLKSELGGKFEDAILAMMTPTLDYDAQVIRKSIKGLGTDEECLIEVLCTRDNNQIRNITAAYKRLFDKTLEDDISGDTSGDFKNLLVSMTTAGRQEDQAPNKAKAHQQAKELYEAGAKRLGTDESTFLAILASQSYAQLQLIFGEYQSLTGHNIEDVLDSELSGEFKKGLETIVKCAMNRPAYFAEKLYKSMKGFGTNDKVLIRIVVTRSEVDMVQIKEAFQTMYGTSVESFIEGDCSGDYKRCLIALVK